MTLTVTPQLIRTSSQCGYELKFNLLFLIFFFTFFPVKNYSPQRRECYFNAENPLRYFKVYNKENCELECLVEYAKILCNCVPFWMPSKFYNIVRLIYANCLARGGILWQ